eukprot:2862141-Prymnesium_polylepis.1
MTARVGHEIARLPAKLRNGLSLMRCASWGGVVGRLGAAVDVRGGNARSVAVARGPEATGTGHGTGPLQSGAGPGVLGPGRVAPRPICPVFALRYAERHARMGYL